MQNNHAVEKAVSDLRAACGFGNSESATEHFLYLLMDAVEATAIDCSTSHEEGLYLDCQSVLAHHIERMRIDDIVENN